MSDRTFSGAKRPPTLLLFGRDGQVGWELQRSLAPLGPLYAMGRQASSNPEGLCGDLSDLSGIVATIRAIRPDVIVNAAAYTAVDQAEQDARGAELINATAPGVMAEQARLIGARLVHYSSDYVLDGSGVEPWTEEADPAPLSEYGRSKWMGERAVQEACDTHLIFRTSWVYGARGSNFVKTMLMLACEKEQLKVVGDQIGAPTGADLIADVTAHAIGALNRQPNLSGLYHLTASGTTSWHGYAQWVLTRAAQQGLALKVSADQVQRILTSEFPRPARRPLNSRLNTGKLRETFGLSLPEWTRGVDRLMATLDTAIFPSNATRNLGQSPL